MTNEVLMKVELDLSVLEEIGEQNTRVVLDSWFKAISESIAQKQDVDTVQDYVLTVLVEEK